MKRTKRINQKELARSLGVSQSAISGVLNDNPAIRVCPETRERILNAIEKANYRPNLLANALLDRQTRTVGVIYQGGYIQLGLEKLFAVVDELVKRGYFPLVYDLLFGEKGEEQCQLLCDLNVKGAILINASYPFIYETYPRFLKGKINVASIDSPREPAIRQIFCDHVQGFRLLTEHLLEKGYRKMALLANYVDPLGVDSPYTHSYGLIHGVTEVLSRVGLRPDAIEIHDARTNPPATAKDPYWGGATAMKRLLDKGCRPEVVICSNDAWAIGAMSECLRRGLRIPDDLAVVGFNDDIQARYAASPLTTVAPAVADLAQAAVRHIIESPYDPQAEEHEATLFPCELVVRQSCGTGILQPG